MLCQEEHPNFFAFSEMLANLKKQIGADEGYSDAFRKHEDAKVRIQRKKLEWVEVKLPDKVIG